MTKDELVVPPMTKITHITNMLSKNTQNGKKNPQKGVVNCKCIDGNVP